MCSARMSALRSERASSVSTRLGTPRSRASRSSRRAVRRESSNTSLPSSRASSVRQTVMSAPRLMSSQRSFISTQVKSVKPSM